MADYMYIYGDDSSQDVDEAQSNIVDAFAWLIQEMSDFEKTYDFNKNNNLFSGLENRLKKLQSLLTIFDENDPMDVTQETVHEAYRIFKIQVLRCAIEVSKPFLPNIIEEAYTKLSIYTKALQSCGSINEQWDQVLVFPFVNVEF